MSDSGERKLTLKQQRFVNYYVGECNGNATQAAIKAGYSGDDVVIRKTASDNLTKPHIVEAIQRKEHDATVAAGIDAEMVKRILLDVATRGLQAEAVTDKEGNPIGVYKCDLNAVARAAELLGRALGVFEADNKQQRPKVSIRNFSGSKSAADSSDD